MTKDQYCRFSITVVVHSSLSLSIYHPRYNVLLLKINMGFAEGCRAEGRDLLSARNWTTNEQTLCFFQGNEGWTDQGLRFLFEGNWTAGHSSKTNL